MLDGVFLVKVHDKISNKVSSVDTSLNLSKSEVFNVSSSVYTYDDAQAVCSAYDAKLATYDQAETAYSKGGEWCNYGWSDGQVTLPPTQKSTWSELQKSEKHKSDCGRPGLSGGYTANPYKKLGVSCYGKKPKPTDDDLKRMAAKQNHVWNLPKYVCLQKHLILMLLQHLQSVRYRVFCFH